MRLEPSRLEPAALAYGDPRRPAPFFYTCEHADNRLPPTTAWDFSVGEVERAHLDDHWGYDIGAADLSRAFVEASVARYGGGAGVLSRFSRLVVDPNRPPESPTFIVAEIDGHALSFNRRLTDGERARRTRELYDPYHALIDELLDQRAAVDKNFWVVGVHSFTPNYLGQRREMEIGVLFDEDEAEAHALAAAIEADGFITALNEPWSGKSGLIYSPDRHARRHGLVALEFEVRYDLIDTPSKAEAVGARLAACLDSTFEKS